MAPQKWASTEQEVYLEKKDAKWVAVKAGSGTLKNFYIQTTKEFVEKWPTAIEKEMQKSDVNTQEEAFEKIRGVSFLFSLWSGVSQPRFPAYRNLV